MKTFYTERDIENLAREGKQTLTLDDGDVLTDLAFEAARKLGVQVDDRQRPPSAPERPYIAAARPEQKPSSEIKQAPSGEIAPDDIRIELLNINNELYRADLITATGGNISVRVPGCPQHVWITPGSIFKGNLNPEMMVRIDLEGNPVEQGFPYRASSERYVHCEVFKVRPDLNAIAHTHAPLATVLGLTGIPFLPISTDSAFIGELTRVPFVSPGTTDLGKAVADAMRDSIAVIMQNHGLVVAGKTLRSVADVTLIIESTAKKILASYMVGKEPLTLPAEAVEEFRKELRI